jgi:hypothetical protein
MEPELSAKSFFQDLNLAIHFEKLTHVKYTCILQTEDKNWKCRKKEDIETSRRKYEDYILSVKARIDMEMSKTIEEQGHLV